MKNSPLSPAGAACALLALVLAATALPAVAHDFWLGVNDWRVAPGAEVNAWIGWGHKLPVDDFPPADAVAALRLHRPGQEPAALEPGREGYRALTLPPAQASGIHILGAVARPHFQTRIEGRQGQPVETGRPRDELAGQRIIDSSATFYYAKALITVGETDDAADRAIGHPLEIVLKTPPATLRPGDAAELAVRFEGKPVPDETLVLLTRNDFDREAFDYAARLFDGEGRVRIQAAGTQYLIVDIVRPAAGEMKAKTDQEHYRATLTFRVGE